MAQDKTQKKKKKREEKLKARRQEMERQALRDKADMYYWRAREAYQGGDHPEALKWALKRLKLDPGDHQMARVALSCAIKTNDEPATLMLMTKVYRDGRLNHRDDFLKLAKGAVSSKDFTLAQEVLEILWADLTSRSPKLFGRFNKAKMKEVEQLLLYTRYMAALPAGIEHLSRGPTTPARNRQNEAMVEPSTGEQTAPEEAKAPQHEGPLPELEILFEVSAEPILDALRSQRKTCPAALDLAIKAYRLSFRSSYDQLICLPTLRNVESLWYQEETARKVMKSFRGRAILADEVGLGKTIEAGLVIKEYMMRGLVRTALVLTPSSLVQQWQEELTDKFGMPFVASGDALFREDPERFWGEPLVLASIQTAKSSRHFHAVTSRSYDIVVVDEAHHLKNRTTLNWKLVNAIQKTFLLMLTATPVQNSVEELYNLVTLLRPGHLKTQKAFKEQFVTRGNPTDLRNRERLRELLQEVMVRNTRSVTQLRMPPRFATTVRVTPSQEEEAFYHGVSEIVTSLASRSSSPLSRLVLKRLLGAAGSSHAAAVRTLENMSEKAGNGALDEIKRVLGLGRRIGISGKLQKVLELLIASSDQKIIFVQYLPTLEYIQQVLHEYRIPHVTYHGGMGTTAKQAAVDAFRDGKRVFLATGTGGEGHNLQFCHIMVNYDLPWNPMEIEQRIGRIHRIGQEQEVQVYNFCAAGTIEDRILGILDRKINMFELVVGEIDMILGRLQGEEEFSDKVYEIWVSSPDEIERDMAFDNLAAQLKRARTAHEKSKELDSKLFQEDFGV
jgi:superfamily II DNA or RNA helicase